MDGFMGEFDPQTVEIARQLAPLDLSGWTMAFVIMAALALVALALTDGFTEQGPRR